LTFRSPFRSTASRSALAALLFAAFLVLLAPAAHGQFSGTHRETNANRRARIQREIKETYTHRFETAGGGGFLRFSSGQFTQKNSEIAFWVNTTYYLSEKLGVTGEVRGYYGNAKLPNYTPYASLVGNPKISEYPFMAGPTYRFVLHQRYAVSAFAEGGTAIGKFDGDTKGIPSTTLGFWPSATARPAFSVGASLDINLYPNLAFRITPNYMGTTFGSTVQNNVGVNLGLVYRYGRQK
jgi:hypothetical protein